MTLTFILNEYIISIVIENDFHLSNIIDSEYIRRKL